MRTTIIAAALLSVFALSCTKVPITGRKQMNLLPESQLMGMSLTNYQQFLSDNKTIAASGNASAAMVQNVGKKIAAAVTKYMNDNGHAKRIEGYNWEFNLVDDSQVNAWCMPGGKVVVYTGIIPVVQNETGLAVVMGHEIAHAIARHGNERMSQQMVIQTGGTALASVMDTAPDLTKNLFLTAYGVGSNLGMLKYSRNHELEADKLGLVFMAMAGYNPAEAVGFWERMSALSGGAKPMELMSTHPSDDRRIEEIKAFLPEANKYYQQ